MIVSGLKAFLTTLEHFLLAACLYIFAIVTTGLALFPSVLFIHYVWTHTLGYYFIVRLLLICFSLAAAYFVYGFSLILIVGFLRTALRLNLKEGEYHVTSMGMMKWMFVNALYILVAITFMDFILLTPFAAFFFRIMGAKVGRNVQINSKNCADVSLLEIGDNTVIGGHATVICHSFERGRLILRRVKIGKNVVIGLNSVILPGADIGDGSFITAGAVLGKNKQVEPHSVYAGVPAESTKERREHDKQ
ncbi:MAG: DapH/DapD/GlmU-related protein [Candidatus Omnitrophota bacterium]